VRTHLRLLDPLRFEHISSARRLELLTCTANHASTCTSRLPINQSYDGRASDRSSVRIVYWLLLTTRRRVDPGLSPESVGHIQEKQVLHA
jgi:hypothetical protein